MSFAQFVLDTNIDLFDQSSTRSALSLRFGVEPNAIVLLVSAGSLLLRVNFTVPQANASFVISELNSGLLGAVFGVPASVRELTVIQRNVTNLQTVRTTATQNCPPGYWCTAGHWVACLVGYYNPHFGADNQSACVSCPLYSSTTSAASTNASSCRCGVGYYNANYNANASSGPDCKVCPPEADCDTHGVLLETLPLQRGFWRAHARSLDIRACYRRNACGGGDNATASSAENGSYCEKGYRGVLCDVCDQGFVLLVDDSCVDCRGGSSSLWGAGGVVAAILLTFGIVAFLYHTGVCKFGTSTGKPSQWESWFNKWYSRMTRLSYFTVKLKILLSLFQVVTTLNVVYDLPRFPFYFSMVKYLSVFNLDFVRIAPLGCVITLNYHSTLLM